MTKTGSETSQSPAVVFLNTAELLQRIPISRKTLWNWRQAGRIPSVQAGGKILFHWPSVENALVRQQRGAQ